MIGTTAHWATTLIQRDIKSALVSGETLGNHQLTLSLKRIKVQGPYFRCSEKKYVLVEIQQFHLTTLE